MNPRDSARSPLLGYNHNLKYKGRIYHVQTEDSGLRSPHVFTHLFYDGTILATKKTDYDHLVDDPDWEAKVREIMKNQHKDMMKELIRGVYDDKIRALLGTLEPTEEAPSIEPAAAAEEPSAPASAGAASGAGAKARPGPAVDEAAGAGAPAGRAARPAEPAQSGASRAQSGPVRPRPPHPPPPGGPALKSPPQVPPSRRTGRIPPPYRRRGRSQPPAPQQRGGVVIAAPVVVVTDIGSTRPPRKRTAPRLPTMEEAQAEASGPKYRPEESKAIPTSVFGETSDDVSLDEVLLAYLAEEMGETKPDGE